MMFLLQFISSSTDLFEKLEDDTPQLIKDLRRNFSLEAGILNGLEKVDYYMYAKRGYDECGDVVVLTHVLRNNAKALDSYAKTIRGFKEHVWTEEHSQASQAILEQFADIPGPKDEGGIPAAYKHACDKGYMQIAGK